jgi:NDP-sugar pyrophosphorylase family protein
MTAAIIMAGGRSSRMRATNDSRHKALVPVLGVPMLERNMCALLASGFRDITIAFASDETAIDAFVASRAKALADAFGANVAPYREVSPLGTIGAARTYAGRTDAVVVVNVDNLTTLDLRALADAHTASGAAMTVATHDESFAIPFGSVTVKDGNVVEYREKPAYPVRISSGTYVLGPRAIAAIRPDAPTGVPELVSMLIDSGERVAAFDHDAVWIDVNDAAGVTRAETLIREHAAEFERSVACAKNKA